MTQVNKTNHFLCVCDSTWLPTHQSICYGFPVLTLSLKIWNLTAQSFYLHGILYTVSGIMSLPSSKTLTMFLLKPTELPELNQLLLFIDIKRYTPCKFIGEMWQHFGERKKDEASRQCLGPTWSLAPLKTRQVKSGQGKYILWHNSTCKSGRWVWKKNLTWIPAHSNLIATY